MRSIDPPVVIFLGEPRQTGRQGRQDFDTVLAPSLRSNVLGGQRKRNFDKGRTIPPVANTSRRTGRSKVLKLRPPPQESRRRGAPADGSESFRSHDVLFLFYNRQVQDPWHSPARCFALCISMYVLDSDGIGSWGNLRSGHWSSRFLHKFSSAPRKLAGHEA